MSTESSQRRVRLTRTKNVDEENIDSQLHPGIRVKIKSYRNQHFRDNNPKEEPQSLKSSQETQKQPETESCESKMDSTIKESGSKELRPQTTASSLESGYASRNPSTGEVPGWLEMNSCDISMPILKEEATESILEQREHNSEDEVNQITELEMRSCDTTTPTLKEEATEPTLKQNKDKVDQNTELDSPFNQLKLNKREKTKPTSLTLLQPPSTSSPHSKSYRRRCSSDLSPLTRPKLRKPFQKASSEDHSNKRKTAKQLTRREEEVLEATVKSNLPEFVKCTDFYPLLSHLGAKELVSRCDSEYLNDSNHTSQQKANRFYMNILPTKGHKPYSKLYECLSKEDEHTGHKYLLHILDKALGYHDPNASTSSSSDHEEPSSSSSSDTSPKGDPIQDNAKETMASGNSDSQGSDVTSSPQSSDDSGKSMTSSSGYDGCEEDN